MTQLSLKELTQSLPPVRRIGDARAQIRALNASMKQKLVVLDDDPTGCQTVHDVRVLTQWTDALLAGAIAGDDCFYILTNTRAHSAMDAVRINRDIVQHLLPRVTPERLRIVSRSDSTLRGHFDAETRVLIDMLGPFDGVLVVPYFREGGRLTVNDTHYVLRGDTLVPAHETEFARDPVFGFATAHLPSYIEEKTGGRSTQADALCVSVQDVRGGGPDHVRDRLLRAAGTQPVILNALCDEDMEVAVLGLCRAEAEGKRFLYRTAASFVKIRAGMADVPLHAPPGATAGLIVVGSHVAMTTRQLHRLVERADLVRTQVTVAEVLGDRTDAVRRTVVETIDAALARDRSVVLSTERRYALTGTEQDRLEAGKRISSFLCDVVAQLKQAPGFIIAKGGITACDLATKGLGVREARVLGQILPGVPLWRLGPESKYPGLSYVVFPGNVGAEESLYEAYARFTQRRS